MALIDDVKKTLRVTQTSDDDLLNRLCDSATMEYLRFIGAEIPTDMTTVTVEEDALNGIILMVQADYDGDPLMREKLRSAAEALWMPYATQDRTAL